MSDHNDSYEQLQHTLLIPIGKFLWDSCWTVHVSATM